jgi:hypothetical protein
MSNPSPADNARETGDGVPSGPRNLCLDAFLEDGVGNNIADGIPNQDDDGIESRESPQNEHLQNDTT